MSKLEGKVAVVTGGSSGIGFAIAERFVREGAHVFITGRNEAALEKARASIGKNVTVFVGDASNEADLERLFERVRKDTGHVDIVVANAGKNLPASLAETTAEQFDAVFDLNVRGTFFTVQKALPLLVEGGSIVLISSATTNKGLPGLSVYSASKAAVRSFARVWASELKERRIRVNTLSPGGTDTPFLFGEASPQEADRTRAMYGGWIPLGRLGAPEEIASAALFLASGESSYATGIDLVVDGGFTQL